MSRKGKKSGGSKNNSPCALFSSLLELVGLARGLVIDCWRDICGEFVESLLELGPEGDSGELKVPPELLKTLSTFTLVFKRSSYPWLSSRNL